MASTAKKGPVLQKIEDCENEGEFCWLMKTEPDVFSIDDLKKNKSTKWDGVRNYQARNFMMNHMKKGDKVLIYHSNATPPGVAGVAMVSKSAVPDVTAWDPKSEYFDEKSTKENPRWFCVEVSFKQKFKNLVTLKDLKDSKKLPELLVTQRGQRLSIQPCLRKEFDEILKMAGK